MGIHNRITNKDGKETCTICGGIEKEIPCECPGRLLSEEEKQRIAERYLDYTDGRWKTFADMGYANY